MPPVKKKPAESEPAPVEESVEATAVADEPAPDVPESPEVAESVEEPAPEPEAEPEPEAPSEPEQVGLIEKYVVHRADDGSLVEAFSFTLVPERDPHAVAALRAYGDAVGYDNPVLKRDIVEKLVDLGLVE